MLHMHNGWLKCRMFLSCHVRPGCHPHLLSLLAHRV